MNLFGAPEEETRIDHPLFGPLDVPKRIADTVQAPDPLGPQSWGPAPATFREPLIEYDDPFYGRVSIPVSAAAELEKLREPPPAPAPDPEVQWSDYGASIMAGGAGIVKGVGWAARKAGAEAAGGWVEELGNDAVDYWNSQLSQAAREELSKEFVRRDENGDLAIGDASLSTVGLLGAQSLLGTAAGMGVGAGLTKLLQVAVRPKALLALRETVKRGFGTAANVAEQAAAKTALAKLRTVEGVMGAAGYGLGEGLVSSMSTGAQVEDEILRMPHDKLIDSPRYKMAYEGMANMGLSEEERQNYARETVAEDAGMQAAWRTLGTTSILSAPTGALFGNLLSRNAAQLVTGGRLKTTAVAALGEAAQEAAQSSAETVVSNQAIQEYADPNRPLSQGALNAAVGGAAAGAALGGAFGLVSTPSAKVAEQEAARDKAVDQALSSGSRVETTAQQARDAGVDPAAIDAILTGEGTGIKKLRALRDIIANPPAPRADPAAIPRNKDLPPDQADIEARAAETVAALNEASAEYAAIPETLGGRVLNTDIARELSPDYRANRAVAPAVHEPASWFIKQQYSRLLGRDVPGTDNRVLFMAGGAGAGKTSALNPLAGEDLASAKVVYDTTLDKYDGAKSKIDQALAADHEVAIWYVYRDPVEAFRNGVLTRAESMGRVVPVDVVAANHEGSYRTVKRLAEEFAGDDRVQIGVINNALGAGKQRLGSLDEIDESVYTGLRDRLTGELDEAFRQGAISEKVYRASGGQLEAGAQESGQPAGEKPAGVDQEQRTPEGARVADAAALAAQSPRNDTPEPTPAQIKAGNYKKGHVQVFGLPLSIETDAGAVRRGKRADGSRWQKKLANAYGYVRGTRGADGEPVDVFLGAFSSGKDSDTVYVVDQTDGAGQFDEHKAMVGFDSIEEAERAYLSNYQKGWTNYSGITAMGPQEFAEFVNSGDLDKPVAEVLQSRKAAPRDIARSDQHTLQHDKAVRLAGNGKLSPETAGKIVSLAEKAGVDPEAAVSRAIAQQKNYPRRAGWASLPEPVSVETNRKGDPVITYKLLPYGFSQDPETGKADKKTEDARAQSIANKLVAEVRNVQRRAEQGDQNAVTIMRQSAWYSAMVARLRAEFGGAADAVADLLGATFPKTPVKQNWWSMMSIIRQMAEGKVEAPVRAFLDYVDAGGRPSEYDGPLVLKASGKKFGTNSKSVLLALANTWRAMPQGAAPKARNFSSNLIGASNAATIDVWAARILQRLAGLPRIPPLAEGAVAGTVGARGNVTGAFGFGQLVFQKAADALGMNPPDLQAVAWFMEKEIWGREGWTTGDGEGGSFEEQADVSKLSRWVVGLSIQQGDARPDSGVVKKVAAALRRAVTRDKGVAAFRSAPSMGLYAGMEDQAFDFEVTTKPNFNVNSMVQDVVAVSKEHAQFDTFVSRAMGPDEHSDNARPGLEVYFSAGATSETMDPVVAEIKSMGFDGFTFVVDPRSQIAGREGEYVGLRIQYIPEFGARWDPDVRAALQVPGALEREYESAADRMEELADRVAQMPGVVSTAAAQYDTLVIGQEYYDGILERDAGKKGSSARENWFPASRAESLQRAIAGYESGDPDWRGDVLRGDERAAALRSQLTAPAGLRRRPQRGRQHTARIADSLAPAIRAVAPYAKASVVHSVHDLPFRNRGITRDTEAVFHRRTGEVFLIGRNIDGADRAAEVFLHEVFGHAAMEDLPGFADILAAVSSAVEERSADLLPYIEKVEQSQGTLRPDIKAREVIAVMAERGVDAPLVRRMITQMRALIRGMGINLRMTQRDIRGHLAIAARRYRARAVQAARTDTVDPNELDDAYRAPQEGVAALSPEMVDRLIDQADGQTYVAAMTPAAFLGLTTQPGGADQIDRETASREGGFFDAARFAASRGPFLSIRDGVVVSHDGAARARMLQRAGSTRLPVVVHVEGSVPDVLTGRFDTSYKAARPDLVLVSEPNRLAVSAVIGPQSGGGVRLRLSPAEQARWRTLAQDEAGVSALYDAAPTTAIYPNGDIVVAPTDVPSLTEFMVSAMGYAPAEAADILRSVANAVEAAETGGRDSVRRTERISAPPVRPDGSVELRHWRRARAVEALDPRYHGRGKAGAEGRRKANNPDTWLDRTYYGVGVGQPGGYVREAGLGDSEYRASLPAEALYDWRGDPDGLLSRAREQASGESAVTLYERMISEAGYTGYWVAHPQLGMVAAVFESLEVAPADAGDPEVLFSKRARMSDAYEAVAQSVMDRPSEDLTLSDRLDRAKQRWRLWDKGSIRQGVIDSGYAIERMERDLTGGDLLDAMESAYKSYTATKNLPSVMAAIMRYGVPVYKDGIFQVEEGRQGLQDVFKDLIDADGRSLLHAWEVYAAARRASRLINETNRDGTAREKNFDQAEIDLVLREGDAVLDADGKPLFARVFEDWQKFNDGMLDLAVEIGAMDPGMRELWRTNDYVPMYRSMEMVQSDTLFEGEMSGAAGSSGRGISGKSVRSKRLTGSDKRIDGQVFENMVMNTANLVDTMFKHIAMQRIIDLGEGVALTKVPYAARAVKFTGDQLGRAMLEGGLITAPPGTPDPAAYARDVVRGMTREQRDTWVTLFQRVAPVGRNLVSAMRDGKMTFYEVSDPLLYRSITALGHRRLDGILWQMFRKPKHILTSAITADPAFMIANFARDTLSAWVTSDAKLIPLADSIRGFSAALQDDPMVFRIMMAGAGGGGFYEQDRASLRSLVASRLPGNQVDGYMRSLIKLQGNSLWSTWQKVGAASENSSRLAIARRVLEAGGSMAEAAYQAQDIMNFSMRGDYAAMQMLIETVPFMNARIQGLYRLYRGARDNPAGFALKGSIIMMASMALLASNWDDDRYQNLQEWDRDANWHIFIGDQHLRLPKPFEVGALFATVPERVMQSMLGDETLGLFARRMGHMALDTFAMNPIPQAIRPVAEQYFNRVFFTGSPVVGMSLDGLPPEGQYNAYTSETMRELAEAMPDWAPEWLRSPARLESVVRGYFGAMGMYALDAADGLTRGVAGYPDAPSLSAHHYPVLKRFVRDPVPNSNKWQDALYDWSNEANKLARGIKEYTAQQEYEKAAALQETALPKLQARGALNRTRRNISAINNQIRLISLHPNYTGDEKADKIRALKERKLEMLNSVERYAGIF